MGVNMIVKKKIVCIIAALLFVISACVGGYYFFKRPYFSVIVCSYNYGHFLPQTIDSVLKSSYQNFELIVVNDGSTDKTSEVLNKYRNHPKITIIEHENQGLSLSRNKAMKLAKGKYFWFVDADDWIDRKALEKLYEKTKGKDIDLVSFYTCAVSANGNFLGMGGYDMLPRKLENNPDRIYTIDNLTTGDIKSYPVTSGKQIYKREFVQKNQIEFPARTLFEDDVFFLNNIFAGAKISALQSTLYYKRSHGTAITADKPKHFDSYMRICRFIWERTHKYPQHEEKATDISNWYIGGIIGRWNTLNEERKYKFYPDLLLWKEFMDSQPDNEDWKKKKEWFNAFLTHPDVQKYSSKSN